MNSRIAKKFHKGLKFTTTKIKFRKDTKFSENQDIFREILLFVNVSICRGI